VVDLDAPRGLLPVNRGCPPQIEVRHITSSGSGAGKLNSHLLTVRCGVSLFVLHSAIGRLRIRVWNVPVKKGVLFRVVVFGPLVKVF
jgi:hypothetical protein